MYSRRSVLTLAGAACALTLLPASADAGTPKVGGISPRPSAVSAVIPLNWGIERVSSANADAVGAAVGESPNYLLTFWDWAQPAPVSALNEAAAKNAIPVVTWEPWLWGGGVNQPTYRLARITAGDFDSYIRSWARALADWGKPVYLRFAHEMNGDWYPWAEKANGNRPGDYVKAWQHVRNIFWSERAANVSFVWCAQAPPAVLDLKSVYPGDAYTSILSLDGYNFGSPWLTPSMVFEQGLNELRAIANKPILIAETSSPETGGDKAPWITDVFAYFNKQPDVIGVIWFNEVVGNWNFPYDSSAASKAAFIKAVGARRRS